MMDYNDQEQMLDAAARQLHASGVSWPTNEDVLFGKAPTPPTNWIWRTRPLVANPYLYYNRSDIILVKSRFDQNK